MRVQRVAEPPSARRRQPGRASPGCCAGASCCTRSASPRAAPAPRAGCRTARRPGGQPDARVHLPGPERRRASWSPHPRRLPADHPFDRQAQPRGPEGQGDGRACRSVFNERTGTPFNELHYPTDVVLLAVLWRLRYKLSFRDVAEMLLQRGFEVTHETVRAWEFRFAPLVSEQLRAKRRGRAGVSWYLDETYVKVGGRWCYLYRAIDHRGDLIDSMLSERRDKHAARRFLRRLVEVAKGKPARAAAGVPGSRARARASIAPHCESAVASNPRYVRMVEPPAAAGGSFAQAAAAPAPAPAATASASVAPVLDPPPSATRR